MTLLESTGADIWADTTVLAASEVVTNAVVHASSTVSLDVWASPDGVRVEVVDGSSQLPSRRAHALTAGTGRGLMILDGSVERWGAEPLPTGKVVWFEVGRPAATPPRPTEPRGTRPPVVPAVPVELRNFPLLMHWAWQEHAQALLREYLLVALDTDPDALENHAHASEALGLLHDQIPVPQLPDDPDELLADAVEPGVSAKRFVVKVPRAAVPRFSTLNSVLTQACDAASRGLFLGPPTQPEIIEMRQWICEEVARQSAGQAVPRPWRQRPEVQRPVTARAGAGVEELFEADDAVIVTDPSGVIIAVTEPVVLFLGYRDEADLLGHRVTLVIPERFHQAHLAGLTLHATNGRRPLLGIPIGVPVVRADGSEETVELTIHRRRLPDDEGVFVATFLLP